MKKYNISILRPGGNDTALVEGIVKKTLRKKINDHIMNRFPNVEQVGFFSQYSPISARLEMAGGEFCGNATRSLAYLLLNGKKGKLTIKTSGARIKLQTGIKKSNTAFAQMPIYRKKGSVKRIDENVFLIKLQGITHLIIKAPKNKNTKELKILAQELFKKQNLLTTSLACGVLFIDEENNSIKMNPFVWVRDIKTLFNETACASGTTAIGLWKLIQTDRPSISAPIMQPSKQAITITARQNKKSFINAYIDGPIKLLKQTTISI